MSDMRFAKFFCHDEVSDIPLATGGTPMTFGSAYMTAGVYKLGGHSWDCTRPGLYRFMLPNEQFVRNRIVAGTPVQIYDLISAVCWNHVHGAADETDNMQVLSNKGVHQRWRLRCGYIVDMMVWLLPQFGISARRTNPRTLLEPNGFDDGHIVLETMHGSEWRMWDLTNGCYFRNAAGEHLSTAGMIAHIANDGPMPDRIMLDGMDRRSDAEVVSVSGGMLDLGLYNDLFVLPDMDAWFRRIFQTL